MDEKEQRSKAATVGDYEFRSVTDATYAEAERKKVDYLRHHLDTRKPEAVFALYCKAITDNFFKTPIGTDFLRELRTYLIEQADYSPEEVPAIPININFESKIRENLSSTKKRVEPPKEKEKLNPLFVSVVLNIALAIGVILMFMIALKTDNPNILNYENAITNRYSEWEQELSERERAVREKELELEMGDDDL